MTFDSGAYSELLALYLGDGCISIAPRAFRLRIALDQKYPDIIADANALLSRCFPHNRVDVVRGGVKGNAVNVSVYSQHLPCLFPQHGPGPKHRRSMVLEAWQRERVDANPWRFLRGCIRSDGCSFVNRTGPYEYLSYEFSNTSEDIIGLFCWACDLVGVYYRCTGPDKRGRFSVRINRRASVAKMVSHVGLKR